MTMMPLMNDYSPYAPPRAEVTDTREGDIWRQGKLVVTRRDAHFPGRCIKCNAPASNSSKLQLYWHTPVLYLLVLISLPIYAIAAYFVRKKPRFTSACARSTTSA